MQTELNRSSHGLWIIGLKGHKLNHKSALDKEIFEHLFGVGPAKHEDNYGGVAEVHL